MRYISPFYRLTLYRQNGHVAHIFKNGELIIGDATTTNGTNTSTNTNAYTIDAYAYSSAPETELHFPIKLDFAGKAYGESGVNLFEIAGEGYLEGKGGTITPIEKGWMGKLFFKAPFITATSTPTTGSWYKVHNGTVTYNGATYKAGQSFKAVDAGGDITVVGTAKYSLELPIEMRNECADSLKEQFKIKHLEHGDEPLDYFLWDTASGFTPRNSLLTDDAGFIGYSR